jgi:hypothetical protein
MRRKLAFFAALLAATSSFASTPTGQYFGAWHVISTTSLSGDGGDGDGDASAMIVQERNCRNESGRCDKLGINWIQGSKISVSIRINDCLGEDEDFDQSYSIPAARWSKAGKVMAERVESDFKAWLGQAALVCDPVIRVKAFDLKQIRPAVRNFTQRLAWLSQ